MHRLSRQFAMLLVGLRLEHRLESCSLLRRCVLYTGGRIGTHRWSVAICSSKDAVQVSVPYVAVREDIDLRVLQHAHEVRAQVLVLGLPKASLISGIDRQLLLLHELGLQRLSIFSKSHHLLIYGAEGRLIFRGHDRSCDHTGRGCLFLWFSLISLMSMSSM